MEIDVYKDKKLIDVWLTRAERDDENFQKSLQPLYEKWYDMKYFVTVFESGDGDLRESVQGLIQFNRRRIPELEQQAEKMNAQHKV